MKEKNWTHQDVKITDIRQLKQLYAISINNDEVKSPLFINTSIFDSVVSSYFLKPAEYVTREEILSVNWNMYLSKGYYVKIIDNELVKHTSTNQKDVDKWYVSFIEIAGELASFNSVYKEVKNEQ